MINLFRFGPGDDRSKENQPIPDDIPREKIGFKDLLAIAIAQYSILLPMVLIAVVIAVLVFSFITYVWLN